MIFRIAMVCVSFFFLYLSLSAVSIGLCAGAGFDAGIYACLAIIGPQVFPQGNANGEK